MSNLQKQGERSSTPTPFEIAVPTSDLRDLKARLSPPRELAEQFYDVRRWSIMPAGGHFTAWEEPAAFVEEIRAFFRPLRPPGK